MVLRAEIDPGDVADAQKRTVGIGAQNDIAELLGRGQAPLRLDVHLELLVVADRARPDAADRRLDVLRLDCRDDVGRRQLEIVQSFGVEPDAHRIVELAEEERLADPGRPGQHVNDVDDRVIGNEQRVLAAVLAV